MTPSFTVGIAGLDSAGLALASRLASSRLPLLLWDPHEETRRKGREDLPGGDSSAQVVNSLEELGSSDVVIESVGPDMLDRKLLLRTVDRFLPPHAALLTTTEAHFVTEIASVTERPGQVMGFHALGRPRSRPVMEVISGALSRPDLIRIMEVFSFSAGFLPLVCRDSPGFVAHRLEVPLLNEVARMVEEGEEEGRIAASYRAALGEGAGEALGRLAGRGAERLCQIAGVMSVELGPFHEPAEILENWVDGQGFLGGVGSRSEGDPSLVSRFQSIALMMGGQLAEEGIAPVSTIEEIATRGLGWAVGPFTLASRWEPLQRDASLQRLADRHPDLVIPSSLARLASPLPPSFSSSPPLLPELASLGALDHLLASRLVNLLSSLPPRVG